MIKATIDRPKLERSLKRFAKDFGENNAQAICRWGVQTCRELAGSTQVFGKTTQAKRKQWNSIEAGINTVVNVVTSIEKRNARIIQTVEELSDWIDSRQDKRGRTRRVPIREKPFVTSALVRQTLKARQNLAGMAKGGWIGAGQDIARGQTGTDRVQIGKNFLSYSQKHARFGAARRPTRNWRSFGEISNRSRHSSASNVLSTAEAHNAVSFGLKKTVRWYASALRRQNKQQKP